MTKLLKRSPSVGFALLLAFVGAASAQEEIAVQALEACTVTPLSVEAGQPSVAVEITPATDIGEVSEIEAAESGLALAEPDPTAEEDVAAEGEAEEPVEMERPDNAQTVWFNTENAQAGTHEVTFKGSNGDCRAEVTVHGTEALPDAGEPLPDAGEPLPDEGEPLPDEGEPLPDAGEPLPDAGEPLPDAGEPLPQDEEPISDPGMEPEGDTDPYDSGQ